MKLIHLSDLHLGKRVNEFPMLEDQEYILKEILNIIDAEKPDCVLIAGDVYDKPVPPAEAVGLFDDFLVKLSKRALQVLIISGNHDSPERLSFGGRLMRQSGVHLAPVYGGAVRPVTLEDEYGPVDFYLLPFIKPVHVRRYYPDEEIVTYTDAMRTAVSHFGEPAGDAGGAASGIDPSRRNVLVTHQFVTGAERSESEDISVGGSDNVDAEVFAGFDYVALGHLHGPQNVGSDRVRYCGTPLKYSFSEAGHSKSVTVVELGAPGEGGLLCDISVRTVRLTPMRDMAEIRGTYEELTLRDYYIDTPYQSDYMHITLTDEEDVPDAVSKLRVIYRNLMKLDYDNTRSRHMGDLSSISDVETKSPAELFAEFYEQQNGVGLTGEQTEHVMELIEKIWEGAE